MTAPTVYDTLPAPTETAMQVTVWRERIVGGFIRWGTFNGWAEAIKEIRAEVEDAADKGGATYGAAMANRFHAFEETITTTREAMPSRAWKSRVPGGTVNQ